MIKHQRVRYIVGKLVSWTRAQRAIATAMALCWLAACGGSDGGTGPASVAISGRYDLVSIDGDTPPTTFPTTVPGACGVTIIAWSLTVTSSTQMASEFTDQHTGASWCSGAPFTSRGTATYRQQGALLLFSNTSARTDTATVTDGGRTFTIKMLWNIEDDGDTTYIRPVFRRAP